MKKLSLLLLLIPFFSCENSAEQDLVNAVQEKDKTKIQQLLDSGADPNADGSAGLEDPTTAMFEAAATGDLEIFEMVLEAGGKPGVELEFGTQKYRLFNVLSHSVGHELAFCELDDQAVEDYITIIHKCVELGADIGAVTDELDMHEETQYDQKNAIIMVAANSSIGLDDIKNECLPQMKKILEAFTANGCTLDQRDAWNNTALIYHVKRRNMNMIQLLVELGADINQTGGDRDASPYWYAKWTSRMNSDHQESEYNMLLSNDNEVTEFFESLGALEICETSSGL